MKSLSAYTLNLFNQMIPKSFKNPPFIDKLKQVGIDVVHLAEFHGGPRTGLSRLVELQVLHSECARLSDDELHEMINS